MATSWTHSFHCWLSSPIPEFGLSGTPVRLQVTSPKHNFSPQTNPEGWCFATVIYVSAAVKLLSALVNVALNLSVSIDNSQRLYEVELAKMAGKRASPRLDRIQRKISEVRLWWHVWLQCSVFLDNVFGVEPKTDACQVPGVN